MKFQKRIICLGIAAFLLLAPSMKASAHIAGCGSTATRVECTKSRIGGGSEGRHRLYVTESGNEVWCDKYSEQYLHNIYCANAACKALIAANVGRKCSIYHSICPDETGLCQY